MESSEANLPWPKKGTKLFIDGGGYYEFSHIGWGDYATQFAAYEMGYKSSADKLIEDAIHSRNISILDTVFYPACFLYRQFLELAMKSIFLRYSEKSKDERVKVIKNVGHNLLQVWKEIKPILLQQTEESEKADIEVVEEYITQFHHLDSSSFTFRYPIDKKLQQTIVAQRRINLTNLRDRMNELDAFFAGCDGKLSEILGWKHAEAEDTLSMIYQ